MSDVILPAEMFDKHGNVKPSFLPTSGAELERCLADPIWRLSSGYLYKIITKTGGDDDDSAGLVVPFRPNRAQRQLLKRLWHRNLILKARQLGFSTLIAILFLDSCLFGQPNTRAGIVCHTLDAAKVIFRDKVKFAYLNLPPELLELFPLEKDAADELLFAHNNSSIRVSTSMRSGTLHFLHVSEFGKICAKFPDRAEEVVTGSFPAAEQGMIFIESTAEGASGHFYEYSRKAQTLADSGAKLTNKQYRFFFFAWWQDPDYRVDPDEVVISEKEHEYFDGIEAAMGCEIDASQRAWWISVRDNNFSGDEAKMWQEYPSTPTEAFQKSAEGCYYTNQLTVARKQGRIGAVPFEPGTPVNTFWDIGSGDGTAVWLHQTVGSRQHFIKFFEGWGESYSYFVQLMDKWAAEHGAVWGRHYLPHDGAHVRQGEQINTSPQQKLENLGLRNVEIVPRVDEIQHGIMQTRDFFGVSYFDEEGCKEGLDHLANYRKRFVASTQTFADEPLHDIHSEAADAYRQAAQAYAGGQLNTRKPSTTKRRPTNWRTA